MKNMQREGVQNRRVNLAIIKVRSGNPNGANDAAGLGLESESLVRVEVSGPIHDLFHVRLSLGIVRRRYPVERQDRATGMSNGKKQRGISLKEIFT